MIEIPITKWEKAFAVELAECRIANKKMKGLVPNNLGKPWIDVETEGVIGELAFFKWTGVYPQMDELIDKYDCFYKGKKVDVKCITDPSHNLMVNAEKIDNKHVVAYVLVLWTGDTAQICGYTTPNRLFQQIHYDEGKYNRPAYRYPQGELLRFNNGEG